MYISVFPLYVISDFFCMHPSMYRLLSSLKEKDNAYVAGSNWCVAHVTQGPF